MPKDQYYKRLESLFSSPDTVPPEPANGKAVAEPTEAALQARIAELEHALAKAADSAALADADTQSVRARLADLEFAHSRQAAEADALRARLSELETGLEGREAAATEADSLRRRVAELETALSHQTDEANAEVDALRERVAELEASLSDQRAEPGAAPAQNAEAESLLNRVVELQTALMRKTNEASEEAENLRARIAELETALSHQAEAPSQSVELAAAQARVSELEVILAQEAAQAEASQLRLAELESALSKAQAQAKAATTDTGALRRSELEQARAMLEAGGPESESIFRHTIEAAGAVPYRRDHLTGTYTYMGDGIRDLLGFEAGEMTTQLLESLIIENIPVGEATNLGFADAVSQARGGRFKYWRSDLLMRHRDGTPRWVADASVEILNEQGQSTGSVGFMQDITERKHAEEATSRRAEQLAAINRVVAQAASTFDSSEILGVAAREIATQLNARNCGIALLDRDGKHLTVIADFSPGGEPSARGIVIPVDDNVSTQHVMQTKRTVVIQNAQTDVLTEPIHELMRARNTFGLLIAPLLARNTVVGTIGVDSTDPDRHFTNQEVNFVETIAGQIAGAMENARLFEESQRRATELATVADVSATAAAQRDPTQMLQELVDLTKERFGLYHAHVYLADDAKGDLILTAGAGQVGRTMVAAGRRIPIAQEQSLVARAARTRQGVIVNDVMADPGFLPHPLLPDTRSEMAIPMIVGEAVLGVLDVQANQFNRFSQEDLRIQSTLAAQAAVALQNARQYEQTQAALRELDLLNRRLTREGWQDYTTERVSRLSYAYDLNEVRPTGPEELNFNGHTLLEHPLTVRGEAIGRLAVAEADAIDDEAVDIVAAVAERLSTHVDNLRLLEETERARRQLDRRAAELEAIARVSAAASTILDRDRLLQTVVDLTKAGLHLYHSHIYVFDEETESLVLGAGAGEVGRKMRAAGHAISLHRQHSLVARAARTRQGVISNDVTREPDFLPNPHLPGTKSELAVPLVVGDRLLGIFDAQSDQFNFFSDEDVRTKTTLAEQVAVALQNAELYAEQAQTVERLRELDQLKSSFLANMSHELRTPLNSILGFAQVMLEGIDGDINSQMENDLTIIQKNGQHLLNLISDILDMAKIEAGKMTLNPEIFDLREVLDEVTELTGPLARARALEIQVDLGERETLDIYADRVRLRQVMINIANNAIKFTERGIIVISAERREATVRIAVKDSGIGIPASHLESIFQEFTQVDTSTTRKAGGTGLGLPISRHLVEMHGGRLWAESQGIAGEGSTFFIELPVETSYVQ